MPFLSQTNTFGDALGCKPDGINGFRSEGQASKGYTQRGIRRSQLLPSSLSPQLQAPAPQSESMKIYR